MKVAHLLAETGARLIVLADEMSRARMAVSGRVNDSLDGMNDAQWEQAAQILGRLQRLVANLVCPPSSIIMPARLSKLRKKLLAYATVSMLTCSVFASTQVITSSAVATPWKRCDLYGARIRHLHLKDVQPSILESARRDGAGFLEAVGRGVFCELGEGAVDLNKVVQEVTAGGHSEWAIVEQDVDARNESVKPFESALRSRQYLKNVIGI